MPLSRQTLSVAAVLSLITACKSDDLAGGGRTSPFVPVAAARVDGLVTTADGRPVPGAHVQVRVQDSTASAYAFSPVSTNTAGAFTYTVQRMRGFPSSIATTDTVRVRILVQVPAGTRRLPDNALPYHETTALLTFGPDHMKPPRTQVFVTVPPTQ